MHCLKLCLLLHQYPKSRDSHHHSEVYVPYPHHKAILPYSRHAFQRLVLIAVKLYKLGEKELGLFNAQQFVALDGRVKVIVLARALAAAGFAKDDALAPAVGPLGNGNGVVIVTIAIAVAFTAIATV